MDTFEEPIDDYSEGYPDGESDEYDDGYLEYEPSIPAHPLAHLGVFSMLVPVLAVVCIGVFFVFFTSRINYTQAAEFANAQNVSTAVSLLDGQAKLTLLSQSKNRTKGARSLPLMFAPTVLYWENEILQWAEENDLDPNLVATVMQIESCGHPGALSKAGAMGLFQVMPDHFQDGEDGLDPATNALRGLAYLKLSLQSYQNNVRQALAGYNAGISGASQPGYSWPAETQRYVYWGSGIYADASAGKEHSDQLQEWLDAGGMNLCSQARESLNLP
jgi:hypothetical protein